MPWLILTTMMLAPPIANGETLRIEQLIEALKSPDYRQREAATAQLKTRDRSIFPFLKLVVRQSDSPEQIWRAKEILAQIESTLLSEQLLAPRLVQLPSGTMTLGEVLQHLQSIEGARFATKDASLFQKSITLSITQPMPFWDAFAVVGQKTGVQLTTIPAETRTALHRLPLGAGMTQLPDRSVTDEEGRVKYLQKNLKEYEAKEAQSPQDKAKIDQMIVYYRRQIPRQIERAAAFRKIWEQKQDLYDENRPLLILTRQTKNLTIDHYNVGNLRVELQHGPSTSKTTHQNITVKVYPEPDIRIGKIEPIKFQSITDPVGKNSLNIAQLMGTISLLLMRENVVLHDIEISNPARQDRNFPSKAGTTLQITKLSKSPDYHRVELTFTHQLGQVRIPKIPGIEYDKLGFDLPPAGGLIVRNSGRPKRTISKNRTYEDPYVVSKWFKLFRFTDVKGKVLEPAPATITIIDWEVSQTGTVKHTISVNFENDRHGQLPPVRLQILGTYTSMVEASFNLSKFARR